MTDSVAYYNPDQDAPLLVVISGPSGVGKDTVIQRMKERQLPFHFVVTATTRPPRPEEQHGVDYFFISHDDFAEMIEQDELLEYAIVYNDYKGIPKEQVRQAPLLIFLTTQNEEELVNRLKARKTETREGVKLRIATARQELKRIEEFDYVVVNREKQLDETVDTILAIIHAEHHRVHPRKVNL